MEQVAQVEPDLRDLQGEAGVEHVDLVVADLVLFNLILADLAALVEVH